MSAPAAYALGRLLWRPLTLWNLFIVCALCWVVGRVAFVAGGGVDNFFEADAAQIARSHRLIAGLLTVLLPAGLGSLVGWAVWDLLLCPFSVVLPGLRGALVRALFAAGLLCAGLTWALGLARSLGPELGFGHAWSGTQSHWVTACEALLWFALGVAAMDPLLRARAWLKWALYALFVARVFGSATAWQVFTQHALVAGPLALAAGALVLRQAGSAAGLRARVVVPACAADAAYRAIDLRKGWSGASAARLQSAAGAGAGRPVPFARGSLRSNADWVRATLFEHFGWQRGGWLGAVLVAGVMLSLITVLGVAVIGRREDAAGAASLAQLLQDMLLGRADAGQRAATATALFSHTVGIAISMFVMFSPFVLAAPTLVPLSRGQRADVAWRASLLQNLGMLAAVAALLVLEGQAVALFANPPRPGLIGAPLVRMLSGFAVLIPFGQWCRLRFIDARLRRPTPLAQATATGLACVVLAFGNQMLVSWWSAQGSRLAWPVEAGAIVALILISQVLWRAVLVRRFRSAVLG